MCERAEQHRKGALCRVVRRFFISADALADAANGVGAQRVVQESLQVQWLTSLVRVKIDVIDGEIEHWADGNGIIAQLEVSSHRILPESNRPAQLIEAVERRSRSTSVARIDLHAQYELFGAEMVLPLILDRKQCVPSEC